MAQWIRWSGLALFCAVWGFVGTIGGVWVMADQLAGDRGATGSAGVQGPSGPPGPRGADADLSDISRQIAAIEAGTGNRLDDVERRLSLLESPRPFDDLPYQVGFGFECIVLDADAALDPEVVTGVDVRPSISGQPFLDVHKERICIERR